MEQLNPHPREQFSVWTTIMRICFTRRVSLTLSLYCFLGNIPKYNTVIPAYVRGISSPRVICLLLHRVSMSMIVIAPFSLQNFKTQDEMSFLTALTKSTIHGGDIPYVIHLTKNIRQVKLRNVIKNTVPTSL